MEQAPESAEWYAAELFYRRDVMGTFNFYQNDWWYHSIHGLRNRKEQADYEENPETQSAQDWPDDTRITHIAQNGGDGMHYSEQRELKEIQEKMAAREAHLKQSTEYNCAPDSLGKYDRRIKGKYNTGTCIVDVYRVLSAFEITEPELQHCIKKLLAAGQRGAKDYQQDLREASVSLCMLIDRIEE